MAVNLERLASVQISLRSSPERLSLRRVYFQDYSAPTCQEMLNNCPYKDVVAGRIVKVDTGPGGKKDAYNGTPVHENTYKGKRGLYSFIRIEDRVGEVSRTALCTKVSDGLKVVGDFEPLPLQDPSLTNIDGETVLSGVETTSDPGNPRKITGWRMKFYRDFGLGLDRLEPFFIGPEGMKNISLAKAEDTPLAIFTRPQGKMDQAGIQIDGGRGKVGYAEAKSLDDLDTKTMMQATILGGLFAPDEWGGVNAASFIHKGRTGDIEAVSHHAYMNKIGNIDIKHYYTTHFIFNRLTRELLPPTLLATRRNFPKGPSKPLPGSNVWDVVYPRGYVNLGSGLIKLSMGVGDVQQGEIVVLRPGTRSAEFVA